MKNEEDGQTENESLKNDDVEQSESEPLKNEDGIVETSLNECQLTSQSVPATLKDVFKSFTKIGVIGFGGGSALIPVIEKEVVKNNHFVDEDTYLNNTIVSNITPGALPVKLCALCGYEMAGIKGMIVGSIVTSLPGTVFTVALILLLNLLGEGFITNLSFASIGISSVIISLLVHYIKKVISDSKKQDFLKGALVITAITTFLTFGKETRELIALITGNHSDNHSESLTAIFNISTIEILIFIFFLVFYVGGIKSTARCVVSVILGSLFFLIHSSSNVFLTLTGIDLQPYGAYVNSFVLIFMIVAFTMDIKKMDLPKSDSKIDMKPWINVSLLYIVITATLCVISVLFVEGCGVILTNGIISTATSFGGGEAYLTVADGMFVESGLVEKSEFYNQIVPIANSLPGSILIKMFTAIGYVFGAKISILHGLLLATTCFMVTTSTTCLVCILVSIIYTKYSDLYVFKTLKTWILPVICGLLISTIITMSVEMIKISVDNSISVIPTIILIAVMFFLIDIFHKKFHMSDVLQIIILGVISLIFMKYIF